MNTDLILQFRTVFESGTIARAATALNMTPGALSRAIKRLEIDLGCTLFMPSGRNIIATKEAELFYHSSSNILQSIEAAMLSVKTINPAKR
jgi:DNA-binding transcriptional LysR family regulator